MNNITSTKLNKIFNNKTSGSEELLSKLNSLLLRNCSNQNASFEIIKESKFKLKTFSTIQSYLSKVENLLKKDASELKLYLENFESEHEQIFFNIYNKIKYELKNSKKIVTISNSKSVFEVLKFLQNDNKKLEIVIGESRPKNEGRILAKKLLKIGSKITFVVDSMLPNEIKTADYLILGADQIFKNGSIANKIGSISACLSAKYFNKPVYVVANKNKLSPLKSFKQESQKPTEVWNYNHSLLTIKNYYFEIIPSGLITKIFTQ